MKFKDFKKGAEDFGFFVAVYENRIEIKEDEDGDILAIIKTDAELQLDNNYYGWNKIDRKWDKFNCAKKEDIFDLIIEFTKTRLEDR